MKVSLRVLSAMLAALLLAASPGPAVAAPDAIFIDADIYTLDDDQPRARAMAVEDGRIAYVGDNATALAMADGNSTIHRMQGHMLLPGFIDTHIHPLSGGAYIQTLSLDTGGSVADWLAAIEHYAGEYPGDGLIFGYGFLASVFGAAGPHREQIDAVVADRPVLIMDESFHGAWANTRALEVLGITRDTPDPSPGFSYYRRDAAGEPTGYLLEDAAQRAMDAFAVINEDSLVAGSAIVMDALNSYGVTALFDAHEMDIEPFLPAVLRRLESSGDLTVRIVGSYKPAGPEQAEAAVATALDWGEHLRGPHYHYRVLKLLLDGTVEGRTAAMLDHYRGEPDNRGDLNFTDAQVAAMVREAAAAGIDVHMHAIGDRAVRQGLDAVETARKASPDSSSRYTICHIEVIADEDLQRFADLDVIAQSSPLWASYDSIGKELVSDDQFQRYWRYHSLAERGVRLTWGSDFPASGPGLGGMAPLLQMEVGITRQDPGDPNAPVQPRASERLGVAEMIRGYTIDAAYQLHMEDEIGSIEKGKRADFVVLGDGLFEVPVHEIHAVPVESTWLGGRRVYQRSDPAQP
ncbi:amidohydrolase [Haliea sp. E17]|uniref:amidohydrolase n=1 Tax=Haliea sp. E17 TaxID=3401576 RepID=UPI003AB05C7C